MGCSGRWSDWSVRSGRVIVPSPGCTVGWLRPPDRPILWPLTHQVARRQAIRGPEAGGTEPMFGLDGHLCATEFRLSLRGNMASKLASEYGPLPSMSKDAQAGPRPRATGMRPEASSRSGRRRRARARR